MPITKIPAADKKNPQLILWNHRWEYDKAPQVFLNALLELNEMNVNFKLALLGERSVKKNAALVQIEKTFSDKIIVSENVSKRDYQKYLARSSIVVSTAIHEFQGLAMLEAVSAGAVPIVPDDLCYKEQYAPEFRYATGDSDALAEKLFGFLTSLPNSPDVSHWYSDKLKQRWREVLF